MYKNTRDKRKNSKYENSMLEWTDNDLILLKNMYVNPWYSIEDISLELKRSPNAIRLMASRLGVSRPITEIAYNLHDPDLSGINYDPINNTLRVLKPIPISEILDFIKALKGD